MHPSYQTSGLTLKKKNKKQQQQKRISYIYLNPKTKRISPAGNRIPVSRVTGRGTQHYTTEKLSALDLWKPCLLWKSLLNKDDYYINGPYNGDTPQLILKWTMS